MTYNDTGSLILACICSMLLALVCIMTAGWLSLAHAQEGDEHEQHAAPPPYMLMLTVHTPGREPDGHRNMPMSNLESCWESAQEYLKSDIPEGAIGISAACGKSKSANKEERPS